VQAYTIWLLELKLYARQPHLYAGIYNLAAYASICLLIRGAGIYNLAARVLAARVALL
jgi:hypothetical protein